MTMRGNRFGLPFPRVTPSGMFSRRTPGLVPCLPSFHRVLPGYPLCVTRGNVHSGNSESPSIKGFLVNRLGLGLTEKTVTQVLRGVREDDRQTKKEGDFT